MQVSFDPLNEEEATYVREMLGAPVGEAKPKRTRSAAPAIAGTVHSEVLPPTAAAPTMAAPITPAVGTTNPAVGTTNPAFAAASVAPPQVMTVMPMNPLPPTAPLSFQGGVVNPAMGAAPTGIAQGTAALPPGISTAQVSQAISAYTGAYKVAAARAKWAEFATPRGLDPAFAIDKIPQHLYAEVIEHFKV